MKKFKMLCKRWFIDAFSGMAMGLFATLIAGTILEQLAKLIGDNQVSALLIQVAGIAKKLMGAGIGVGIAHALKADKLVMFSCLVAGLCGANGNGFNLINVGIGNPIGAYLSALIVAEVCMLFSGKTKVDIVIIPLVAMLLTAVVVFALCPPVTWFVSKITDFIIIAMNWNEFIMGIVISVIMGILLTMPTSSAAIWVSVVPFATVNPALLLASGAAVVGCASQMVGFAVSSFRENRWGGLVAQGLGTSMLQIPNIMKNPWILLPPTIASAVVGPLATVLFKLKCNGAGGGMGTAGLVGVIQTIAESTATVSPVVMWIGIILLFFVLPGFISLAVSELLRKKGKIKLGDMALKL